MCFCIRKIFINTSTLYVFMKTVRMQNALANFLKCVKDVFPLRHKSKDRIGTLTLLLTSADNP